MTATVAAIQMNSGSDRDENLAQAGRLIAQAGAAGAQLVVLPEVFAFIGTDLSEQLGVCEGDGAGPIQDFLATQAKTHGVWLVGGTFPMRSPQPHRAYAACAVYDPEGHRAAVYRKMHLFDVRINETAEDYSESRVFVPGDDVVVVDTPAGRCGLSVCYDLRFPELFRAMLEQSVDLVVVPSAFTMATGRAHWETLLRARAIENLVYIVAANQAGRHANGRETWGHSMVVDPWGAVIAELADDAGVVSAECDRDYQARVRREFPCIEHRRPRRASGQ